MVGLTGTETQHTFLTLSDTMNFWWTMRKWMTLKVNICWPYYKGIFKGKNDNWIQSKLLKSGSRVRNLCLRGEKRFVCKLDIKLVLLFSKWREKNENCKKRLTLRSRLLQNVITDCRSSLTTMFTTMYFFWHILCGMPTQYPFEFHLRKT